MKRVSSRLQWNLSFTFFSLIGSIRLFVSAPTPGFLVLAVFSTVVSSTPLIPLSSTQPSCPSRRSKCWLSSLVSSCGPKNCLASGFLYELTFKTPNLPSTPVAHVFPLFNHVYANFSFMLPALILRFAPFISRATRTPLLILSVAGTLIHNLNTPSTRPPTSITAP